LYLEARSLCKVVIKPANNGWGVIGFGTLHENRNSVESVFEG
jgi:hypothetical protein